jgi:hypothetical protein
MHEATKTIAQAARFMEEAFRAVAEIQTQPLFEASFT